MDIDPIAKLISKVKTTPIPREMLDSCIKKHADKDPEALLENIDEEANEGILFIASLYYQDLGHRLTPEMITLVGWYIAMHPEFLRETASASFTQSVLQSEASLKGKSRAEQLAIGS